MKMTNIKNKFIALLLVFTMLVPSLSYVTYCTAEDVYAYGMDDSLENVITSVSGIIAAAEDEPTVDDDSYAVDGYEFKLNADKNVYNFDTGTFTFNDIEYNGIYINNAFKADNNENLTLDQLGTIDNPYVVLEVTPAAEYSELRPHVADAGYFDLSQKQIEAIELSADEKEAVRIQVLYQMMKDVKANYADEYALAQEVKNFKKNKINGLYAEAVKDALHAYVMSKKPDDETWELWSTEYQFYRDEYLATYFPTWTNPGWLDGITYDLEPGDPAAKEVANEELEELVKQTYPTYKSNPVCENMVDMLAEANGGTKTISEVADEAEAYVIQYLMSEDVYKELITSKEAEALNYKILYEKANRYYLMSNTAYNFDYNYIKSYAVKNGKFVRFEDAGTKKDVEPSGDETVNALRGEYQLTTSIYNPMAMDQNVVFGEQGDGSVLLTPDYTFRKGALNLAYKTQIENGVIVGQQSSYIDEYIFTGWCVEIEGVIKPFSSLTAEEVEYVNKQLETNQIKDLYTSWSVRRYGEETYYPIIPSFNSEGKSATVDVDFGTTNFTVHLPDEIASNHPMHDNAIHNFRNQLTMCTPVTTKILCNYNDNIFETKGGFYEYEVNYAEETSAWDFDFSMSKYNSIEKLEQVAPKLMADTDYYVRTYNAVYEDGIVTYYPFNVLVMSVTIEELNKMVYYDSVYKNKTSAVGYKESSYLNTFMNNMDLYYLASGGASVYFKNKEIGSVGLVVNESYKETLVPVMERCPTLFEKNADGQYIYKEDEIVATSSSQDPNFLDYEWQIVDKMYRRVMDTSQKRRASVLISEVIFDGLQDGGGYGSDPVDGKHGSECNIRKLSLLLFALTDPTMMYDFYANPKYTTYDFDKLVGVARENEYHGTYFTGSLYDATKWTTQIFFPFEALGLGDHKELMASGDYKAHNSKYMELLYSSIGLAYNPSFKGIANQFAYTFNSDGSAGQEFFTPNIVNRSNPVNHGGGNTSDAFDYFTKVRPTEFGSNGNLAPESAVEFMVQNVRNGAISNYNRKITITNKSDTPARFLVGGKRIEVDTVIIEEFSSGIQHIDYKFTSDTGGYFVVEFLWTPTFIDIDSEPRLAGAAYIAHIYNKDLNPDGNWYTMPTYSQHADAKNNFINYLNVYEEVTNEAGEVVTSKKIYNKLVPEEFHRDIEYYFDALWKPNVAAVHDGEKQYINQPRYIIAVKQYANKEAYYNDPNSFRTVTLKNVMLEKMTYLFNLD